MLNSDTKRHIDAARDVLVGVAPNPTTQIDQITYALIYKFMDDMDQAAIKAGGEPSFFIGDLEQFAWSKLMDARMGNQEKMNQYGEALVKFSEAKQLPELFRTIFRSAFLPYRSPETLGLFLKEISYFDYTHPEELGNAYEYLLSIMSSQGDAGQFRTPRHIIDFIVDVLNPTKDDKVLDPACGTGGFLVSTYNHILEQHDGKNDPKKKEKPLTPDERKKLMANLEGYDIDPTMVRIAQVNMYLHQFKNPQIFQYDSLTSEDRWNDKFDVILANPPFMSPKGGIKPHNKFGLASNRSEVLFVDYIVSHLRPKGRAGIIVPEGIIFQSGVAYKALRKNLVENGLYAVVSLPGGVFQPYSGVKTSILLLDNELAKQKQEIAFVKISADGYDLGASKRAVSQNDLPVALELLNSWASGVDVNNAILTLVNKEELAIKGEYNLSGDRYKIGVDHSNTMWPIVRIGDVFQIESGGTPSTENSEFWDGDIPWATLVDIPKSISKITTTARKISKTGLANSSAKIMPKNTVLVSSRATIGRIAITDVEMATNQGFKNVIVGIENNASYVAYALSFKVEDMIAMASGGTFKEISKSSFSNLEIPLPPLEIQEQIVAELDSFAAIISGAKQIVDNWRPKFDVDPAWPVYKLSDLCELITKGTTPTTEGYNFEDSGVNFLKVESISENGELLPSKFSHVSPECHEKLKRAQLKSNDVLFSIAGALGRTAVVTESILPANINQNIATIRLKPDSDVDPQFLQYSLGTDSAKKQSDKYQAGVAQQVISLGQLGSYLLEIPPLEVQKIIVESIQQEKNLIKSALILIETYEARTKAAIAKLWSE
jgi:type I restriction enzyme M protein